MKDSKKFISGFTPTKPDPRFEAGFMDTRGKNISERCSDLGINYPKFFSISDHATKVEFHDGSILYTNGITWWEKPPVTKIGLGR